jgi:ABC-type branched-subunit amino acid transport system substrate-binding protein
VPAARRSRALLGVLAVSVLLVACGNRSDVTLRQRAAQAQLYRGDGAAGSAPQSGAIGGLPTSGPQATTGPQGSTVVPGSQASTAAGPSAVAAPLPVGGNGGATAVGVTGDSITVGNVSDLSGPVPGIFQGAVVGTQAYFAKVNSEGGVYGRQLKLAIGDGQLDCSRNKAVTADLAPRVFAFVGSFSLYDDCGSDIIGAKPGLPDVHSAIGTKTQKLANNFSFAPMGRGWRTGPLAYYRKTFGTKWQHIGAIYANVGGSPAIWAGVKTAIEHEGGKVVSEYGYGPADTDFTSTIIRMRNDGVQMIYNTAVDGAYGARFVNAARSQQVPWPIVFGGGAYDKTFLAQAGANANGVWNDAQYALFFNSSDAANIPAVKDFQYWTDVVGKDQTKDLYEVYGWASAALYVPALKAAGPQLTQAKLLTALRAITRFDAGGLVAAANPAQKRPATCWVLAKVVNGSYQRLDSPASAFRCDGGYFP